MQLHSIVVGSALHVIVDGGLDDALSLAVLAGHGVPIAQVVATEGSVARSVTASATARWMSSLGSSSPVRIGEDRGIERPYPDGRDPFHGVDGFGGIVSALAAAVTPTEPFRRLDGTVLCTGALTSVARGLRLGHGIEGITWMGGSGAHGGNKTPWAEFNAWMDPWAADEVLTSGVQMRMVPLDVTTRFVWGARELRAMRDACRPTRLLADAVGAAHGPDARFIPHDAVTAVSFADPDLFSWGECHVRCETAGMITRGQTVIDRSGTVAPVLVADDVDVQGVTEWILAAIGRFPR